MPEPCMKLASNSPDDTRGFGKRVGEAATGGMILGLTGDLGSGKTVFVQGMALGMGVPDQGYVTSPTYTLVNEYMGRLPLFHLDLYRLDNPVDLDHIGLDDMIDRGGIIVIEWADRFDRSILPRHVDVRISVTGEENRCIQFIGYGLEGLNLISGIRFLSSSGKA